MGINLILYKLPEETRVEWFDTIRYVGDREFVFASEPAWQVDECPRCKQGGHKYGLCCWQDYQRPTDFAAARKWVQANNCHKARLTELLDAMEKDPDLWIYLSV